MRVTLENENEFLLFAEIPNSFPESYTNPGLSLPITSLSNSLKNIFLLSSNLSLPVNSDYSAKGFFLLSENELFITILIKIY